METQSKQSKTQILHITKQNQSLTKLFFKLNNDEAIQYESSLKYLLFDVYINSSTLTYELSVSGSKALGSLLAFF